MPLDYQHITSLDSAHQIKYLLQSVKTAKPFLGAITKGKDYVTNLYYKLDYHRINLIKHFLKLVEKDGSFTDLPEEIFKIQQEGYLDFLYSSLKLSSANITPYFYLWNDMDMYYVQIGQHRFEIHNSKHFS
jgi:hypothetical protein